MYSPTDAKALERASGTRFAGDTLQMSEAATRDVAMGNPTPTGPRSANSAGKTKAKENTIDVLKQFLATRYQSESKMLDLSRMHDDPILKGIGLEANTSASSKMFPALMKLLSEDKLEVVSISLEGNRVKDVVGISALAQTYPKLRNLSLANNDLRRYKDLDAWAGKNKLAHLSELILTGNPVREDELTKGREVEYRSEITKRFPSLKLLDGATVAQGISFGLDGAADGANGDKTGAAREKIAVRRQFYENESVQATVMEFLGKFFVAYDGDRSSLEPLYAESGVFTMSLNVSAPRKKTGGAFQGASWQAYIGASRNLTRITQIDARIARTNIGRRQIVQALQHLPKTKHDLSDATLFAVDSFTFTTSDGSPLIQVNVHGEFREKVQKQESRRSFDRTFVLGPVSAGAAAGTGAGAGAAGAGAAAGGVEIRSDLLMLRSWGGSDAWREVDPSSTTNGAAAGAPGSANGASAAQSNGAVPAGFVPSQASGVNGVHRIGAGLAPGAVAGGAATNAIAGAGTGAGAVPGAVPGAGAGAGSGVSEAQKQALLQQLQAQTGLNAQWAALCLQQMDFDLARSVRTTLELKAQNGLPPEAFA